MNCHPSLPAGLLRWWLRTGTCLLASALPVASTLAAECEARASGGIRPTINVRVDNDLFGGREQDQGYSNGILITAVSPNLLDYEDDPCLPRLARGLSNHLDWLSWASSINSTWSLASGRRCTRRTTRGQRN